MIETAEGQHADAEDCQHRNSCLPPPVVESRASGSSTLADSSWSTAWLPRRLGSESTFGVDPLVCCASVLWMVVNFRCSRSTCGWLRAGSHGLRKDLR